MTQFSKNLKRLRKSKSLTQKEFAAALQMGITTYASYEQGKTEPKYDMLIQIADYYKVSTDLLGSVKTSMKTQIRDSHYSKSSAIYRNRS